MEITCSRGERIILTDNLSQTFIGIVKTVNADLGRVVLTDIVQLPEYKPVTGYRNFDKNEIVELNKYKVVDSDSEIVENLRETSHEKQTEKKSPDINFNQIKKLQSEYRYIKDFGTNFHSAISYLKTCRQIGVLGKDVSKGRFGRASVLAISAPDHIFVFDLLALGDDVLDEGLKEILESPSIVKIVHDCRLLSDCFKHKHLIGFENVRDVEAEDIMVVFQDRKIIRRHSRSLEYLIKVYLGMEIGSCEEAGEVWDRRPLPLNLLESLVSLASYLIPLQEAVERKYLQKLIDASDIYNGFLRNLDFFDFLHDEPKKTLKKQISKILVPQNQTRTECKSRKSP